MGVPQQEHKVISSKIFARILFNVANNLPITVNILDITVVLLGAAQYHDIIDRVAIETILFVDEYRNRVNFIPASRSSIKSLKKTRLDSLEESVIRLIPSCAICLEDFAECTDQMVTTLPCKHQYHEGCIVQSLEISHLCPLCRYPMPIVETD
ncbi:putative transcription factor C2H2 family [Rosa chinensis]|uniref:RING-type E3 ubiquitin transferase n=2 Tax=Rosa chinensis TaxID=74649 RepID=A0A2P6SJ57_ROSCH|nr:putative transcription factor C2H2 family [Rosa chinensis]